MAEEFCRPCRDSMFLYHRKPSVETLGYGQACHDTKLFRRWALSVERSTFSSVPAYAQGYGVASKQAPAGILL